MNPQLRVVAQAFVLAVAVLLALGALQQTLPWTLVLNRTPSIARGLYLAERAPLTPPKRGDIVCVAYAPPDWAVPRRYLLPGTPLCKYVLGLPGENLDISDEAVHISTTQGRQFAGSYAATDSAGRALPRAALPAAIPTKHYFLGVPEKPNSLDSRYLGLAQEGSIVLRLHPVLTW